MSLEDIVQKHPNAIIAAHNPLYHTDCHLVLTNQPDIGLKVHSQHNRARPMAVHAKLVYALPPVPNILARSETLLFLLYVRYKNREKILSERSMFILVISFSVRK